MLVSVVICTYNRADKILKCLNSVHNAMKNAMPIEGEIVIVNNNSKDNTVDVITQWLKNSEFSVNLITEEKQGIAYARNRSFTEAKGDLLISLDDDCCLDANHIKNVLAHYKNDKEPILRFGQLDLGDIKDWPMTIQTRPSIKRWKKSSSEYDYITMGDVCSANMMIPREIIDKVGLYDSRFGTTSIPGGEDADFGFRVYNAGFMLEYVPDVTALHYHGRRDPVAVNKLIKGYSISAGALFVKHNIEHPRIAQIFSSRDFPPDPVGKYVDDPRTQEIKKLHKKNKLFYIFGAFMFIRVALKQKIFGQG